METQLCQTTFTVRLKLILLKCSKMECGQIHSSSPGLIHIFVFCVSELCQIDGRRGGGGGRGGSRSGSRSSGSRSRYRSVTEIWPT